MHMLGELSAISDEIIFLGDGEVLWQGMEDHPLQLEEKYHEYFGEVKL